MYTASFGCLAFKDKHTKDTIATVEILNLVFTIFVQVSPVISSRARTFVHDSRTTTSYRSKQNLVTPLPPLLISG